MSAVAELSAASAVCAAYRGFDSASVRAGTTWRHRVLLDVSKTVLRLRLSESQIASWGSFLYVGSV